MFIARSWRRKIIATLVGIAGFFVFYEATIFDSRFATRQVQSAVVPVSTPPATAAPPASAGPGPSNAAAQAKPDDPQAGGARQGTLLSASMPALHFVASAYCKGETTASGVVPRSGVAAADEELLPVGSVVQVSSLGPRYDGVYTIMDTGPKVQGRHVDLYLWSCKEAVAFGRRNATVVVLRLGWSPQDTAPTLFDRLLDWGQRAAEVLPGRKKQ